MAVAEITRYALTQEHPQGRIVEVLGSADAPDMELRLILRKYGLPTAFPGSGRGGACGATGVATRTRRPTRLAQPDHVHH